MVLDPWPTEAHGVYRDTPIVFGCTSVAHTTDAVPEKIRQMNALYRYYDSSMTSKCRNFYIQGKFMEDYEDNVPWNGEFRRYFTTYHDLRTEQLRGYFTWRTKLRKGLYEPIASSLAYLYLYELLNGIGADSPEDSLLKMKKFESGYLDAGYGDSVMRKNLHRWMLELSVLHALPPEQAREFLTPDLAEKDCALEVLRDPGKQSNDDVFEALCAFGGDRLRNSVLFRKAPDEGKRLFAALWRSVCTKRMKNGEDLFTECFGTVRDFHWHPLENAVYWDEHPPKEASFRLNACRVYTCRNGIWTEHCYDSLYYNRGLFEGLIQEADRKLRLYLKTGSPLKEKSENAWAAPLADAIIEADRKEKLEAARPKISIRYDDLDRIRRDATETRDSLLTEEEKEASGCTAEAARSGVSGPDEAGSYDGAAADVSVGADSAERNSEIPMISGDTGITDSSTVSLDAVQLEVLSMLVRGDSVTGILQGRHLMTEVFADALNEALFDEIGDTAVDCDGENLRLLDDYRDDIARILGGKTE